MKKILLLALIVSLVTFCGQKENKTAASSEAAVNETSTNPISATYYLIRHAEKVRTNPTDPDPSLAIKGMLRAKRWAEYFEPFKIDNIYITKYIRTKQTISFVAQQKQLSPIVYIPNTLYSEAFLNKTNHKTTLIVGHSNTIPQLVNKLIGEEKFENMDDTDNATLFKVTIDGNSKKVETITVE
ncbi:phosphoglycerate mutase family protein [Aequorivita sp. Q41]|uniref:SixA phosphatase family protein n=1 Tax=Aequorivita sp. Q41 TaxID=3153300 RepID=UPI003242698A